ncbi:MAG: hypothetical protein JWO22_3969 [Frankiales bacterium]|nr:hypothetical protein [Frankiales bacterium]
MSAVGTVAKVGWALSPWAPAPAPRSAAAVDAAWLEKQLGGSTPGAALLGLDELGGHAGTTDRRRVRLHWNTAGEAGQLPEHLFLKGTAPSAKNRTMVSALDMAVNEVLFFERVRPALGDLAPVVHAAHAGKGARHLLVMDDLVAQGATPYSAADDCSVEHARAMMATLAELHATFQDSPRFSTDLAFVRPMTSRPGAAALRLTMRRVRSWFLREPDKRPLPPAATRMLELLQAHDRALYASWEHGPLTLLHGDSHLGNTYRTADGRAGLLDWQVVWRGRGIREVAYFLGTGVPIELRRGHEHELIELYLDGLGKHGAPHIPTVEQAWADYRFFLFDAWDSASICQMWPGLQTPENVARSCERVNAAVEDLEVDAAVRQVVARL